MSTDLSTPAIQRITRTHLRDQLNRVRAAHASEMLVNTGHLRLVLDLLDAADIAAPNAVIVQFGDWGVHDVQPSPTVEGRWCARCGVAETTCSLEGNVCRPLYAGAQPYGGRALSFAALASAPPAGHGNVERVRHVKSGGDYEVFDRKARLQTNEPLTDYAEVVVYRSTTGTTWVRPVAEMNDGRFVPIASAPPAPTPEAGSDLADQYFPQTIWYKEADAIEFVLNDGAHIYRELDHGAALVLDMDTRAVVGFRISSPAAWLNTVAPSPSPPPAEDLAGQGETQTADHIAALAVSSEDVGRELTLAEVLEAGFKRFGYAHPAEAAREACETIAAGPLPPRAVEADALCRIYSQFIVNRGDLSDAEALEAIRQVCEQAGQGGDHGPT